MIGLIGNSQKIVFLNKQRSDAGIKIVLLVWTFIGTTLVNEIREKDGYVKEKKWTFSILNSKTIVIRFVNSVCT